MDWVGGPEVGLMIGLAGRQSEMSKYWWMGGKTGSLSDGVCWADDCASGVCEAEKQTRQPQTLMENTLLLVFLSAQKALPASLPSLARKAS